MRQLFFCLLKNPTANKNLLKFNGFRFNQRFNKSAALLLLFSFCLLTPPAQALDSNDLLRPEQAYIVSALPGAGDKIIVTWKIAEGYYLYRDKISITSKTAAINLDAYTLPAGKVKHDQYFGDVAIFRGLLKVPVTYTRKKGVNRLQLAIAHQGCADRGVCYPPQKTTLDIDLPAAQLNTPAATAAVTGNPIKNLLQGAKNIRLNLFEDKLLPADDAFQFYAEIKDDNTLQLNWKIAEGYYLYREKFAVQRLSPDTIQIGDYTLPHGAASHDEAFGPVEIFHNAVAFDIPLIRSKKAADTLKLQVKYQGCAERGVCYPPQIKTTALYLPPLQHSAAAVIDATATNLSEQDLIIKSLHQDTLWLTLLSFLGFGLLLSVTPCIFPMIPILSGIIIGHGHKITIRKGFFLSLCYVLASAVMYTVFGIIAALFGSNLQATFQEPWIIASFSAIFVLLSLSMFGFYNLELPKSLQTQLHHSSEKHRDGSYFGAAIMGALSALIVGPCVAAPLAGALIYIGQTGDVILGGSALFMMGLGMGAPLLVMGASAGKLLPKAGAWMNSTKAVFGVIMLGVAVWMLERILAPEISMLLWAMLLIIPAVYLSAIDPLPETTSGWQKLWKGSGLIMLVYGVILLIGLGMGNTNPLKPLHGFGRSLNAAEQPISFERIATLADLEKRLQRASINQQWVMLDFYADWCISCKEMESYTFTDPRVQQLLSNVVLIQADVTANNPADQALLKRFELIGPPGIVFFDPAQQQRRDLSVIGYQDADTFITKLQQAGI